MAYQDSGDFGGFTLTSSFTFNPSNVQGYFVGSGNPNSDNATGTEYANPQGYYTLSVQVGSGQSQTVSVPNGITGYVVSTSSPGQILITSQAPDQPTLGLVWEGGFDEKITYYNTTEVYYDYNVFTGSLTEIGSSQNHGYGGAEVTLNDVPILSGATNNFNGLLVTNYPSQIYQIYDQATQQTTFYNNDYTQFQYEFPAAPQSTLSIKSSTPTIVEGDSGVQTITFEVTRSGDLSQNVSFDWTPANFDPVGGLRVPGAANYYDYTVSDPTTITFLPGETTKTIHIDVLGDTMPERDEPLIVQISSTDAAIVSDTAQTTIVNDDGPYTEQAIVEWALKQETVNAISGGKDLDGLSPAVLDRSNITAEAWNFINENRHWDSQDTTLRNAEYYLFGFEVATQSNLAINVVTGLTLSVAAGYYDLIKLVLGHAYQENPDSPNSPAGGGIWALQGVLDGLKANFESDQSLYQDFLDGSFSPQPGSDVLGLVADGYLSGATVFADTNGNGNFDSGEPSAISDSNGFFVLAANAGPLTASGGTDALTGLHFAGAFMAPENSIVISPLTTLVVELQNHGLGQQQASDQVLTDFGIPLNFDLGMTDPIAATNEGDFVGAVAYVAGAKVYDTVSMIASALVGAGGGFMAASQAAFAAIATAIDGPGISLSSQSDVSSLITSIAQSENLVLGKGVADSVAAIVVASNLELDQKLQAVSGDTLLNDAAAIENVVQGAASNAIQQASNDPAQVQSVVDTFTGANLDSAIATALSNLGNSSDPTPPTLTPVANQTDEATGPQGAVAVFSATATDAIDGSVPVVFKEGNTVVHSGDTFALGTHTLTASAVDATGNQATETFTVNVVDTTAPVLTPVADETVHATSVAGAPVVFSATASDAVDGSDPVVFTENNTIVQSGEVFALGSHVITASTTDAAGNSASETFVVNVADQAPIVSALSASVGEDGPTFSQNLLANTSDPDVSDTLSVTGLDGAVTTAGGRALVLGTDYTLSNSTIELTGAGFAKFNSLSASQTDQAVFHYNVSDGILTTADSLTLTVVGANDGPILVDQTHNQSATAGTPFVITLPSDTFQDPDNGDHLTLTASLSNGKALPSWLSFDAATDTLKGTPGATDTGSVDIAIKATDTGGLSVTDAFELAVTGGVDHAPVITSDGGGKSASVVITDDTKYVDTVHATDPDPNTTIKYSIVGGEDQKLFTINPATGDLSFKSLPKDGHDYEVKVAATDGTLQDTQTIDVQVAKGVFEFGNAKQADTFVFKPGFGVEVVNGFDAGSSSHDVLELDHTLFRGANVNETASALLSMIDHHSFQLGHDVIILTDTHDIIDLHNTNLHSLTAKDFLLT